MNTAKFLERLTDAKTRGAERKAARDTPAKKAKAEQDEYDDAVKLHIQNQILDAVNDGKSVFQIMTPPIQKADNMVTNVCADAGMTFLELDQVVLETEYITFGMCSTLRVFQITVPEV